MRATIDPVEKEFREYLEESGACRLAAISHFVAERVSAQHDHACLKTAAFFPAGTITHTTTHTKPPNLSEQ